MKLADNYDPEKHKVKPNRIYVTYKKQLDYAFNLLVSHDDLNEKISKDSYIYHPSADQHYFLNNFYVKFGEEINISGDLLSQKYGDDVYRKFNIGSEEKRLLDFIDSSSLEKIMLLIAPVGWGKSTLLFHTFFYVLQQIKYYRDSIIPIYISVDPLLRKEKIENRNDLRNIIVKKLIEPQLIDIILAFVDIDDDNFWELLTKFSEPFRKIKFEENYLKKRFNGRDTELRNKIFELRQNATHDENFYFYAIKAIQNGYNKQVVFIFDDFDPLDNYIHDAILDEALFYKKEFGIKTVISMRKSTYNELISNRNGILTEHRVGEIFLSNLSINEFISKRIEGAFNKVKSEPFEYNFYDDKINVRITQSNGKTLILNLLNVLLHHPSYQLLDFVAFHDLKKINKFLELYLQTGFVEKYQAFYYDILHKNFSDELESNYPLWILLSSIITGNYETHFSTREKNQIPYILESVINLYCNKKNGTHDYSINPFFIRFHILNFIMRVGETSVERVLNSYANFIKKPVSIIEKSVRRVLFRFLQGSLIVSPQFYQVESLHDMNRINVIRITETGKFYLTDFSNYFEYIQYLKDDVDLPDNNICKDCIEVSDKRKQYEHEVLNFCRWYFSQEKAFIQSLNNEQRNDLENNFSQSYDNNSPIIIESIIKKLIEYGNGRNLDSTGYIELSTDILQFKNNFFGG